MRSLRFCRLLPVALIAILIWCILFQESFFFNRTEVRQEIVYKFYALNEKQVDSDFEMLRSPRVIDRGIIKQLLNNNALEKPATHYSSDDRTRAWFLRKNQPQSTLSLFKHPLFRGYIIDNPDLCGESPVDLLIYIHSRAENFGRRRVIRDTWADTKLFHDISIRTVFILGIASTESDQTEIHNEYAAHGDIIQGNFMDTFRNLTMKAITTVAWTNWHCPQAKYILKADDDYFVDTFEVVEDFLPTLADKKMTFECRSLKDAPIIRSKNIKWHIESNVLSSREKWPLFCSGFFVLYTGDLIPFLYKRSFNITEYVSVDDAYLFGLLTEGNTDVNFIDIRDKLSLNTRPTPEDEILGNTRFEFPVFEIELPETTRYLWDLRLKRLSEWGKAHSLYVKLFKSPGRDTVIIR